MQLEFEPVYYDSAVQHINLVVCPTVSYLSYYISIAIKPFLYCTNELTVPFHQSTTLSDFISCKDTTVSLFNFSLYKALGIALNFFYHLVHLNIVDFKNCTECISRGTAQVLLPLMRFQQKSLIFSLVLATSFFFRPLLFNGVSFQYPQVLEIFPFSKHSGYFLIW